MICRCLQPNLFRKILCTYIAQHLLFLRMKSMIYNIGITIILHLLPQKYIWSCVSRSKSIIMKMKFVGWVIALLVHASKVINTPGWDRWDKYPKMQKTNTKKKRRLEGFSNLIWWLGGVGVLLRLVQTKNKSSPTWRQEDKESNTVRRQKKKKNKCTSRTQTYSADNKWYDLRTEICHSHK